MPLWVREQIPCHGCGHEFSGMLVQELSVTRYPEITEALLAGTLHRFACPACERIMVVERPFCYSDLNALHCVLVQARSQIDSWRDGERDIRDLYEKYIVQEPTGQLFGADELQRFKVRAVYGYERMREKLLLWREDLDDRLMEVAKLHLLAKHTYLVDHGYLDLYVTEVSRERDALTFKALPPRGAEPLAIDGDLQIYRELVAAGDTVAAEHPALFQQPFVDYRRYSYE